MLSRATSMTDRQRRGAVLRVMLLSLMLVVSAVASLNVALPDIARDTGASQSELQWIVDAYALVFAALLLPAGAIGDRFGRKTLLAVGLGIYGGASVVALFASTSGQLIGLRALMGLAAALIMPVTLSVVTSVFPPEERGKAVGTWVGVAAGGAVVGLLASGLLLEFFAWQSIFALNVVLATAALVGTLAIVPSTRQTAAVRLDPVGVLLSVAALGALVFGTIEGPERGWSDALTISALIGGTVGLVLFVTWELRRREPMLDARNFLRRGFGAGSASLTVQFFAMFGFLFLALPYLQLVQGFSPLQAALGLVPMAMIVIPLSRKAPAIAAHAGVRVTGTIGLSLMATGFLLMATLEPGSPYWQFLAGLLPFGAGVALAGAPATTAIVASLPPEKQGVASAVNDVSRELGGALGIAVLGSLLNTQYRSDLTSSTSSLPAPLAGKAESSLAAAQQIGERMGVGSHHFILQAQTAFMNGFGKALLAAAATLLVGAAFVALRAPGRATPTPARAETSAAPLTAAGELAMH
jgi:EmrB/QacA subfamily drug resistance transporter